MTHDATGCPVLALVVQLRYDFGHTFNLQAEEIGSIDFHYAFSIPGTLTFVNRSD